MIGQRDGVNQRKGAAFMTTTKRKLLTAEDLLELHAKGIKGKLIRGVFHKNEPSGGTHGEVAANVCGELSKSVKPRSLGRLAVGVGVWMEHDPDTVRKADILFVSAERLPLNVRVPGYLETIPELVVEVVSFNESPREVHDKAHMWLRHGVTLVWVADPDTRTVDVYRQDGPTATLYEDDVLDGAPVLPGFTLPVREVFE